MPRLVFLVVINAFLDKSVQVSLTILCLFAGELCRGKPTVNAPSQQKRKKEIFRSHGY